MIQVDVFWSFAMGASFAALAPEGIRRSSSVFNNKYFVYNVCFLSMIFAPSGAYLLWQYPSWESMFFFDRSLPGIYPCLFAHTNVSLGVLGFVVCYKMIKMGHDHVTHGIWTLSYTCMFSILTFGYDRFLYAGKPDSLEEWKAGVPYELIDFFKGEVFFTLLAMSIFVLPPLFYAMTFWPSEYGITTQGKKKLIGAVFFFYIMETMFVLSAFYVFKLLNLLPVGWGFDRMAAFMIGQLVFGIIIMTPLCFIPLRNIKKE